MVFSMATSKVVQSLFESEYPCKIEPILFSKIVHFFVFETIYI